MMKKRACRIYEKVGVLRVWISLSSLDLITSEHRSLTSTASTPTLGGVFFWPPECPLSRLGCSWEYHFSGDGWKLVEKYLAPFVLGCGHSKEWALCCLPVVPSGTESQLLTG